MINLHNKPDMRHGGPYDRGSADRYYRRPYNPHFFVGPTYQSQEITRENMTKEQIEEYTLGYNEQTEFKDWG